MYPLNRQSAQELAMRLLNYPEAIILDTETTDLNGYIVELAVISMQGEILYHNRLNPLVAVNPRAAQVHHITDADLASFPTFAEEADTLRGLLQNKLICAYNASFDQQILENECRRLGQDWGLSWQCLMKPYSAWVGEWNPQRGDYRWQKLPAGDHSALGDCFAALKILRQMASR